MVKKEIHGQLCKFLSEPEICDDFQDATERTREEVKNEKLEQPHYDLVEMLTSSCFFVSG